MFDSSTALNLHRFWPWCVGRGDVIQTAASQKYGWNSSWIYCLTKLAESVRKSASSVTKNRGIVWVGNTL